MYRSIIFSKVSFIQFYSVCGSKCSSFFNWDSITKPKSSGRVGSPAGNPHSAYSFPCTCHYGGGHLPVFFDEREISSPAFSFVDWQVSSEGVFPRGKVIQ